MRGDEDFFAEDGTTDCPDRSPEEIFHEDVLALLRVINRALKNGSLPKAIEDDLMTYAGFVEGYYDNDDPVANGWVGSDGRP